MPLRITLLVPLYLGPSYPYTAHYHITPPSRVILLPHLIRCHRYHLFLAIIFVRPDRKFLHRHTITNKPLRASSPSDPNSTILSYHHRLHRGGQYSVFVHPTDCHTIPRIGRGEAVGEWYLHCGPQRPLLLQTGWIVPHQTVLPHWKDVSYTNIIIIPIGRYPYRRGSL